MATVAKAPVMHVHTITFGTKNRPIDTGGLTLGEADTCKGIVGVPVDVAAFTGAGIGASMIGTIDTGVSVVGTFERLRNL